MSEADAVRLSLWTMLYQDDLMKACQELLARVESDIETDSLKTAEGEFARELLEKIREATLQ